MSLQTKTACIAKQNPQYKEWVTCFRVIVKLLVKEVSPIDSPTIIIA